MSKKLKRNLKKIIIGAVLFGIGIVLDKAVNEWAGLAVYVAAYIVLGFDVLKNAAVNISHGHVFDENFLMTLATVAAFVCRDYEEAVAVMLFYQVGEWFQSYAVNKSRKSIKALMEIRPDYARPVRNGETVEVDPSEVNIGETIEIRPGERVPLDGIVISGNSMLDTAAITGESIPRDVSKGDTIVSGCVNKSGVLTVKVTNTFGESTVSKILSLVEDASSKKASAEKFITVFARVYTPIIVGLATLLVLTGSVITHDILTWAYRGATFLLISCPCALVISIPLSFFGGIGGAGKHGVLIKGGNYMDVLAKVDTLVLDKTGTITKGNFAVSKVEYTDWFNKEFGSKAEAELIKHAAHIESFSSHPIAQSIVAAFDGKIDSNKLSDIKEIAGEGIEALYEEKRWYAGNYKLMERVLSNEELKKADECLVPNMVGTVVYIVCDDKLAGHIHIVDEIKDGAKESLEAMRKYGISEFVLLTGDNEATANAVAREVGIDKVYANLSPVDKVNELEKVLEASKGKVAFVGDGINDAPVLARADLGIAMGAMGSDAAIEAADVVIMTDNLDRIAFSKKVAKGTLRIVKENIIIALTVKVAVLILAAIGFASMWAAIFADVGVAFIAILNATRALRIKE